jgi:aldehyde:ferredoxin oxidoreductase
MGALDPVDLEYLGPEKARACAYHSMDQVMGNCVHFCLWVPWTLDEKVQLVRAATGWDVSAFELLKVGERALTLARAFNVREGFTAKDDRLPERSYGPTRSGYLADGGIDRDELYAGINAFYGIMGWNEQTGVPTAGKLYELGVPWAVEHLSG